MHFRAATVTDVDAISTLLREANLPVAGVADHVGCYEVAFDGDDIAGVAGLEPYGRAGLLRSLVVAGRARGQGLASELVARVSARACRLGVDEIYLLTLDADGYFERLGFVRGARDAAPAGIRSAPEFASICPDSAVCMRRALTGRDARPRILILNPNSTQAVTDGLNEALAPLRMGGGPHIDCATLAEGPPGIESDEHVTQVAEPICDYFLAREHDYDAFIIACFSDPGLDVARAAVARPVLGMAECGLLTALTRGQGFGVVSILDRSIPRHLRYYDKLGIASRLAGDRAIELGVVELGREAVVSERLRSVGARLRDEDGAAVLVLGCAGMARYRAALEVDLGIPVVDPVQAATTMAIGAAQLGTRSRAA